MKQKIKNKIVATTTIIILCIVFILPVTLGTEDFEDDTGGNNPSESWYTYEETITDVSGSTFADVNGGYHSSKTFNTNNTMNDNDKVLCYFNFSSAQTMDWYSADIYVNNSGGPSNDYERTALLSLLNSTGWPNHMVIGVQPKLGEWYLFNNSDYGSTGEVANNDTWYNVNITVNWTTEEFQFILDDVSIGWYPFYKSHQEATGLSIRGTSTAGGSDMYFDNITVQGLGEETNSCPTHSNPSPASNAVDQNLNPPLNITINDADGDTMNQTFRTNASGSWIDIGWHNSTGNQSVENTTSTFTSYSTKYWWSSNTTDGTCWTNVTYNFTTKSESTWSDWSDTWTIPGLHNCSPTGYLYGNWSEFEHIRDNTFDDEWVEANDTQWYKSTNSWWAGNYTYNCSEYSNSTFTLFNNSGTNRSQALGWVHKDGFNNAPYPFVIFAYNNSQDFDCIIWWKNNSWFSHAAVLHWNGTHFIDIDSGTVITNPDEQVDAIDDIRSTEYDPSGYITLDGYYYKYIYNALNGTVLFKFWDADTLMDEPRHWAVEFNHANLTRDKACHGIGVLDIDSIGDEFAWDILNVWQLNYTRNTSSWCNISGHNDSRPHMNFPVLNLSTWSDELWSYLNGSYDGTLGIADISLIMKDNITNPMNMESRMFEFDYSSFNGQQNDTVYYYSCLLENYTDLNPEATFDDWLHLHIQMCPEDNIETGEYGDIMVGIDVDNDRQWDVSDRFYWGYIDDTDTVTFQTYNGNGDVKANIASCNIWNTSKNAVGNIHRYYQTLNYALNIPLADLVKSDGYNLNTSDTFGLSILTTTSGTVGVTQDPCVWQNWNETNDASYLDENNNITDIINYFYNTSAEEEIEGYIANTTNLKRWGEGQIIGTFGDNEAIEYNMTIEKTANISSVAAGSTYALINYTIWINNTGSGEFTNVVVNDTKFNCSCHDFNETSDITTNVTWTDVTNHSCFREFANTSIPAGANWKIWYVVNVSNCSGVTTGTLRNNVSVNATELDSAVETYYEIPWGATANRVCVYFETDITAIDETANTIFTIVGIILILGAILSIIIFMRKFGVF